VLFERFEGEGLSQYSYAVECERAAGGTAHLYGLMLEGQGLRAKG